MPIQQCQHPENFGYALKAMLDGGIAWIGSFEATEWTAVGSIAIAWVQIATSRAESRAYVFVETTELKNLRGVHRMVARSKVTNFGKTPAYKLTFKSELFVKESPPTTADITETKTTITDLGPGQFMGMTTTRHALTEEEIAALRERGKTVYLLGVLTYEDAYRRPQTTTFLLRRLAPKGGGFLEEGVMSLCETGNEAT